MILELVRHRVAFARGRSQNAGMSSTLNRSLATAAMVSLLVLGGCSNAPMVSRTPGDSEFLEAPSRLSQEQANDITMYAVGLVGTPYRYGGNTPGSGFDCSGLIGHVYQTRAGIAPPRTVSRMQNWGQAISMAGVRSGDLVLFAQNDSVTHAGIYVGGGRFVHAPSTGGDVRLYDLNLKYWSSQQVAFRRP